MPYDGPRTVITRAPGKETPVSCSNLHPAELDTYNLWRRVESNSIACRLRSVCRCAEYGTGPPETPDLAVQW